MEYPFKFRELLVTSKLLDVLGFTDGDDDCGGVSCTRCLLNEEGFVAYRLSEIYENPDVDEGYGQNPEYTSEYHRKFNTYTHGHDLYFLHELYEDIAEKNPKFVEKTKEVGVNVFPYIKYWLQFKEEQITSKVF